MGSRLDRRGSPRLTCCIPKATRKGAGALGQTGQVPGMFHTHAHAHTHTHTHTHTLSPDPQPQNAAGALGQVAPEKPESCLGRVP